MTTAPWALVTRARLYPSGRHSAAATAHGATSHNVSLRTVAASTARGQRAYHGWNTGASRTVAARASPAKCTGSASPAEADGAEPAEAPPEADGAELAEEPADREKARSQSITSTTARTTREQTAKWRYKGYHAWFQVRVSIEQFVVRNGVEIDHNLFAIGRYELSPNINGSVTIGQNLNSRRYRQTWAQGQNLNAPSPLTLQNTLLPQVPQEFKNLRHIEAYFGQAEINLYEQLFLNVGVRNDGFSK